MKARSRIPKIISSGNENEKPYNSIIYDLPLTPKGELELLLFCISINYHLFRFCIFYSPLGARGSVRQKYMLWAIGVNYIAKP